MIEYTSSLLSFRSPLMIGISGAVANQAKKQTKKAIHVRWKARICGVANENRLILVALTLASAPGPEASSVTMTSRVQPSGRDGEARSSQVLLGTTREGTPACSD